MNTELHAEVRSTPLRPLRREPIVEARARVVEYVRQPHVEVSGAAMAGPALSRPAPLRPALPWWVIRLLVAWGLVTLASLAGPCRPPAAAPALAAEATP